MFGIGGRKLASQFTHLQRGKSKARVFLSECDLESGTEDGERRGLTSDTAIDND
jgi:hypothetical protein